MLSCFTRAQLFGTQWDPPDSSVHGILRARILEWVALPFLGDLLDPEIKPMSPVSPALAGGFFTTTWEALSLTVIIFVHH